MASYNRVVLVGNCTREVELKYTQSGMAVTEIGLALNEKRKTASGEWVEEVTFVDVTLWGKTAEVCGEYVTKGQQILVEGRLKQDTWDDKQTGQKRSKLKVTGDRLVLLGSKRDAQSAPPADAGYRPSAAPASEPQARYDDAPPARTGGEPEDGIPF